MNIKTTLANNASYIGNNLIKLDSVLNHCLDPQFIEEIAEDIYSHYLNLSGKINKVITAEASGIAPAFCVAKRFNIPLIYARKNLPKTMSNDHAKANVYSRTKGTNTPLYISKEFLKPEDKVLIVDDVLGTGGALSALISLINDCGSEILGSACVIEKTFENARNSELLKKYNIYSVAKINIVEDALVIE